MTSLMKPLHSMVISFSVADGKSLIRQPEAIYFGGSFGPGYPNFQQVNSMGYIQSHINPTSYGLQNQTGQGQVSGIDPTYLAAYSNNAGYVSGQHPNQSSAMLPGQAFAADYQNRPLFGPERNKPKTFSPQVLAKEDVKEKGLKTMQGRPYEDKVQRKNTHENFKQTFNNMPTVVNKKKANDVDILKSEMGKVVPTRADKIKALHKGGPRAFTGGVENVLRWHKSLQDIGLLILYEVVAKCVSIRQGESCAKHLVIRDDKGPAMQVVYYEIDFLLPELTLPCVVRVIGRMLAGTCRLQAFNVRPATGDDVATLPRRSAVAIHQVTKLCKDFQIKF